MTSNQIKYWTLLEEKRHNVATESETNRHNTVEEGETYRSNTTREYETMRHNKETERISALEYAETRRHNVVYEQETARHNREQEDIGKANVNLGYANLAEAQRHNVASENISWANIGLGYANLAEQSRHNVAQEAISQRDVAVREQQNVLRSMELDETIRHNQAGEQNIHEGNIMKLAGSSNYVASAYGIGLLTDYLIDEDQRSNSLYNVSASGFKSPKSNTGSGALTSYMINTAPFSANVGYGPGYEPYNINGRHGNATR